MLIRELADYLQKLENTSSRLEIRDILKELFDNVSNHVKNGYSKDLYFAVAYFLTGQLTPEFIPIEFGLQEKTVLNILTLIKQRLNCKKDFGQAPDLGDLWYDFIKDCKDYVASKQLTILDVYEKLLDLALISGKGAVSNKSSALINLLLSLDPLSGKYVIRMILGKLRLGVNTKSLLDAVTETLLIRLAKDKNLDINAFLSRFKEQKFLTPTTSNLSQKDIKEFLTYLYGVTNDIGFVIYAVFELDITDLINITSIPQVPIASQLAEREKNIQHVFARIPSPVLEPKYDGLRGQVHVLDLEHISTNNVIQNITLRIWYRAYEKVLKQEQETNLLTFNNQEKVDYMIFSRNASNLTNMFPEVEHDVDLIKNYIGTKNLVWLQNLLLQNYRRVLSEKVLFKEALEDMFNKHPEWQNLKFTQTTKIYSKKELYTYTESVIKHMSNYKFVKGAIFDSEIIGYDENTGEFIPFQQTISRRRKYNISEASQDIPVRFYTFDLMFFGVDLIHLPFALRRFLLEYLFKNIKGLKVLTLTPEHNLQFMETDNAEKLFDYYVESGLEGVMFKDPSYTYCPGVRNYAWIKYKRAMKGELADTLDVVVLGYYKGKGRRASLGIGAFLIGVYDSKNNVYVSISKLGTGITDDKWVELKKLADEYRVGKKPPNVEVPKELVPDVWVYPHIVMVVEADEITKSPIHTAGYALRFPRFKEVRFDKDAEQATTKQEVEEMYKLSKNK